MALPYTWCQLTFTASLPGGICYHIMVVMCVNTLRTVGAFFPSLGGFFPRLVYTPKTLGLTYLVHSYTNLLLCVCAPSFFFFFTHCVRVPATLTPTLLDL